MINTLPNLLNLSTDSATMRSKSFYPYMIHYANIHADRRANKPHILLQT